MEQTNQFIHWVQPQNVIVAVKPIKLGLLKTNHIPGSSSFGGYKEYEYDPISSC
jgi:hypothetical protein